MTENLLRLVAPYLLTNRWQLLIDTNSPNHQLLTAVASSLYLYLQISQKIILNSDCPNLTQCYV